LESNNIAHSRVVSKNLDAKLVAAKGQKEKEEEGRKRRKIVEDLLMGCFGRCFGTVTLKDFLI
jgi:hypothetical protein